MGARAVDKYALAAVSATPCRISLCLPVFDARVGAPGGVPRLEKTSPRSWRVSNFAFVYQGQGRSNEKQRFRNFPLDRS